jgi:hypothetical protein
MGYERIEWMRESHGRSQDGSVQAGTGEHLFTFAPMERLKALTPNQSCPAALRAH